MAYQEFDGELDGAPGYTEFSGALDAPKPRTKSEAAMDGASSFGASVNNTLKTLTDLAGTNNPVSQFLGENAKTWQGNYSPAYQAELQKQAEEKAALGADPSYADRAGLMAKQVIRNPIEGVGELAGNIAPMMLGGAAGLGLKGMTALSAAMGAGAVKGGIAETVQNAKDADLMPDPLYAEMRKGGLSEDAAKAALSEQRASYGDAYGKILLGAGIGAAVGRFGSVENAIANMGKGAAGQGFLKSIGKEVVTEIPQEMTETYLGNTGAASRGAKIAPDQGVIEAGVKAGILSAVGGGVAGLTGRPGAQPNAPIVNNAEPAPVAPQADPLQLGNTPDPMIGFPDGTLARRSEVERYIASLPEDQQVAARAKMSGFAPQPTKPADILQTESVEDAITVAEQSIAAPVAPSGLMGSTPTDEQELAQLVQSEQRNLQVMRAQMEQDRIKQAELDQIPAIAAEQNVTQGALQRAASLEAPTAMELAFRKLSDNVPEAKEPAPVPAPAPKPVPEPRIVERTEGMIPVPRELADLRVEMNGGEVVRVRNQNGKYAYVVLPDDAKPSLAKLANSPIPRMGIPNGPTIAPTGLDQSTAPSASDQLAGSGPASVVQRVDGGRGLSDTGVPVASDGQADTVPLPSRVAGAVAPTFPHTVNPSGTVLVEGDPAAIRAAFPGVAGAVKFSDGKPAGILFGVKSAPAVLDVLQTNAGDVNVQNTAPAANDTEAKAAPTQTPAGVTSQPAAVASVPGAGSAAVQADGVNALRKQLDTVEFGTQAHADLLDAIHTATQQDATKAIESGAMPVYAVGNGMHVALSPSAQNPGQFQITRYSPKGIMSDSQYSSIEQAVTQEGLSHKIRLDDNAAADVIGKSAEAESKYQEQRSTNNSESTQQKPASPLVPITPTATESVAPAAQVSANGAVQQVQSSPLGRNNVPLAEGGKHYKTKMGADVARKNQPMMRTKRVEGGFVLVEKTPAQLAAQEKAAKRLSQPRTSPQGEPIPAHSMIASAGGLRQSVRSDMGIGDNPKVGNRRLFAGTGGLTIEQATEKLVEDGYLQEGASHSQAMDLIKRSLTNPQYTPEGTERMAQKEQQEREAAYQAEQEAVAEIESATDNEIDQIDDADIPWDAPVSNSSLEDAMMAMGFSEQEIQDAIANESTGQGQDSQSGQQVDEGAAAQAQGDIRSGEGTPSQDQGSGEGLTLTAPTRQDVIAQQDALDAEAKRKEEGGDKPLPRRELTGDVPDMFNPQGSVFDQPAEPAAQPAPQSKPATPLSDITVKIKAVEAESGKSITMKEKADIALKEVDDQIEKAKNLLLCLKS